MRAFYQKLFHGPGIFAERLNTVQPMAGRGSGDRRKSSPSSATASIRALCLPAGDGNKQ